MWVVRWSQWVLTVRRLKGSCFYYFQWSMSNKCLIFRLLLDLCACCFFISTSIERFIVWWPAFITRYTLIVIVLIDKKTLVTFWSICNQHAFEAFYIPIFQRTKVNFFYAWCYSCITNLDIKHKQISHFFYYVLF